MSQPVPIVRAVGPTLSSPSPENRSAADRILSLVPASLYVVAAIILIQFASAAAKEIITPATIMGLVFLRTLFGAILITPFVRPDFGGLTQAQWLNAAGLGLAMTCFTALIYSALNYLPLGLVVTIGFLGPLSVSLLGARGKLDFFWPLIGFAGVLLLAPWDGTRTFDPVGLVFALFYALSWAAYILMSARSATTTPGFVGFNLALWFTALFSAPFGLVHAGSYLTSWSAAADVALITILATLPFAFEFLALKRLRPAVFGVLLSTEPAIAALVGLAVLGEALPLVAWVALALVSFASFGSSWFAWRRGA